MASRNSDGVALERVLGRGERGVRGGVKGSGEREGGGLRDAQKNHGSCEVWVGGVQKKSITKHIDC